MTAPSSYFAHLPRIYRDNADLDALLKVFEKILSGRDDDVAAPHRAITERIDILHTLFDPATVERRLLPWLGSLVGLDLQPKWDDAMRRRAIGEIVGIYGQRGSRAGLARYLDLYSANAARQRITIDDAAKVLFCRIPGGGIAPIRALVTHGPVRFPQGTEIYPGLVSAECLAVTPDGTLVVGDSGEPGTNVAATQPASVWRMTRTGEFADFTGAPPKPRMLGAPGWEHPVALAVDPAAPNWALYVLDLRAGSYQLFRITRDQPFTATRITIPAAFQLNSPSAMLFEAGHLLVLDITDVIDVDLIPNPPLWKRRPLTGAMTPLSMTVTEVGDLYVTDGREQDGTATPAELLKVDRSNPGAWTVVRQLAQLPASENPLVAPVAIVEDRDGSLLVLDVGLKPLRSSAKPFLRTVVEPSAVYRVRLGQRVGALPRIERTSSTGRLVFPTAMVRFGRELYFTDRGDPNDPALGPDVTVRRNFRAASHEFGVTVHFDEDDTSVDYQRAVIQGVSEIVEQQRPAASWPWLMSAVGR
ncbi:phage tail protein [Nocardia sp. NBC_00508]|uniref:phage tail protein n=1 Tax=Nocardia sp. NBC_00508 TaxID=2975992 RepID=UPI002E821E22|nr:phage tail protein [Nocardia sp. NBC_00508]WUD66785.1 phage tail protein [Nocardia sp. NBC_00508]